MQPENPKKKDNGHVEDLLRLCEAPGITGFERSAAETAAELLRPLCDNVEIDPFGSVLGLRRCGRPGAKTVLLDAHIDQIGFLVTEVLEGGFLRFAPVGGVDPRMLLGCEVEILTPEPLFGVISCTPPHLLKPGEEKKSIPVHKMLIDTGLTDARGTIPVGTPVVFAEKPVQLTPDSVTGKCLDDRAGVFAILQAVRRLQAVPLAVDLAVQFSVQEEVTSLGAMTGAFRVLPDFAIAVDVSHAKTPDAPADSTFAYGGGVMIGMGPNFNTPLTKSLIKTAKAEEIDYQLEVMEGNTGTNAWEMQIAATGTAMGLLSIPLRYMHTPIESILLSDLASVSGLLYHFLRNFEGEVRL